MPSKAHLACRLSPRERHEAGGRVPGFQGCRGPPHPPGTLRGSTWLRCWEGLPGLRTHQRHANSTNHFLDSTGRPAHKPRGALCLWSPQWAHGGPPGLTHEPSLPAHALVSASPRRQPDSGLAEKCTGFNLPGHHPRGSKQEALIPVCGMERGQAILRLHPPKGVSREERVIHRKGLRTPQRLQQGRRLMAFLIQS